MRYIVVESTNHRVPFDPRSLGKVYKLRHTTIGNFSEGGGMFCENNWPFYPFSFSSPTYRSRMTTHLADPLLLSKCESYGRHTFSNIYGTNFSPRSNNQVSIQSKYLCKLLDSIEAYEP